MKVHLQGLGVIGSLIAWELERAGLKWTWSDIDSPVTAWRACTGAIFPTGDPVDMACLATWRIWRESAPWARNLGHCVEESPWWYCTKAAPHGAKLKPIEQKLGLQLGPMTSLHFNAQKFVPETRTAFHRKRVAGPSSGDQVVVTHGFGERLHHVVWGWTRRVRLKHQLGEGIGLRPAIYLRRGRFVMAYAYPIPDTPYWYAGSNLIVQTKPKQLSVSDKYARWKKNFLELSNGAVQVTEEEEFLTGWRPASAKEDPELVRRSTDGRLLVRPHWHNGVRNSPAIVAAVMKELR